MTRTLQDEAVELPETHESPRTGRPPGCLDMAPEVRGSTLGFSINYLEPAIETTLIATAEVVRRGRSIAVVNVGVHDERGKLVAQASVTYKFTRPR